VFVPYLLLAAPALAAALFWGSWGWVAAAVAIAVIEHVALQRSQRFSSRIWRTVGVGRRSQRARVAEGAYVLSAVAGVAVLIASILGVD